MKRAPSWPWYSDDRVGWAVYAVGLVAMFGVFWASVIFEGRGDISEQVARGWLFAKLLFAAGAFALSGPVVVTIAQLITGRVVCRGRVALVGSYFWVPLVACYQCSGPAAPWLSPPAAEGGGCCAPTIPDERTPGARRCQ